MSTEITSKQRGRPPAFDHAQALEKALRVFWERGYEGASMAELTEAMGINKPSLYGAFGNKEELFRKALEKYCSGPVAYVAQAIQAPTARAVAEELLTHAAERLADPALPRGCMVTQGALSCGESAQGMRDELAGHRNAYLAALRERFERAQSESDLPAEASPAALARYLATVHQGMSVQATSGATREELLQVVREVLAGWPSA